MPTLKASIVCDFMEEAIWYRLYQGAQIGEHSRCSIYMLEPIYRSAVDSPQLYCPECGATHPISLFTKTCSRCSSVLFVGYDYNDVAKNLNKDGTEASGLWNYSNLLPPSRGPTVSLGEGGTFLQRSSRLADACGVRTLYLKNETMNPTGSFIDRGVAVEISGAVASQVRELQCAPTGNLGASLAAYAARAGLECTVNISADINPGKLLQMIAYDARIKLGSMAPSRDPKCLRVTPVDPYILEGEKTIAFEVWDQLRPKLDTHVIAPMGTGGLITMLWKGMRELVKVGVAEEAECRLTGVQASGCAPIVEAFRKNTTVRETENTETLAIDLKVTRPPLGDMALDAIHSSHGSALAVSDEEILEATRLLAKTEGIFAEPVSASTVAALKKMVDAKEIDPQDEVVCVITGAGLKDPSATSRLLDRRRRVKFLVRHKGSLEPTIMGKTKTMILQLLGKRETYGYEAWKQLGKQGIHIRIPSIYQHFSELEALGLVERSKTLTVAGKPERRCYLLTTRGRETLTALNRFRPDQS